jgi:FtsP/CotA-like multicopper oxidase with cupredoxin domain
MTALDDRPATGSGGDAEGSDDGSSGGIPAMVYLAITGVLIALVLGVFAVGVVALIQDDDGGDGGSSTSSELNVQLSEFSIDGQLTAPEGEVTLEVVNAGAIEHNLAVRGTDITTPNLQSREVAILPLGELSAGTYELYCTIAGHESSGMVNELTVVEGEVPVAEGAAGAEGGTGEGEIDGDALDQIMIDSMMAYPAETEGTGNQVLEPTILADGTKQFELTAAITPWEVSPGEFVDSWSYNGMVPGPAIHVDLDDKVQVIVNNETPLGTDVHWHGVRTPNNQDGVSPYTQDPIRSGETFTYEFVADEPSIGMYHAHLHSQVSVPNGMFGVFTIGENPLPLGQTISGREIPADLEPAFEMPMVLNDAGVIGLSLNGKSFPATEPVVMAADEWGVVHYYNEGLTDHPMHMHQFPQLVYAKDGIPLEQPYWADTINVAPGERYSILFNASDPGTWVWHCHILTHVERDEGMFGMVTAVVVTEE